MGSVNGGQKMIPFDFEYYKADTVDQAYQIMKTSLEENKRAVYYAGGTELVTNFRKGKDHADIVIDIKGVSDMMTIQEKDKQIIIGAGVCLNQIIETLGDSSLSHVLEQIADHTTRNALSIGGNLAGRLPYKEAVLPLLAVDAKAVIQGEEGRVEKPLKEVFNKTLRLKSGELLIQLKINKSDVSYYSKRETEGTKVDYPILHMFSTWSETEVFVGVSGFSSLPEYQVFDISTLETNNVENNLIFKAFKDKARACHRASVIYRQHLLKCAIEDLLLEWKGRM